METASQAMQYTAPGREILNDETLRRLRLNWGRGFITYSFCALLHRAVSWSFADSADWKDTTAWAACRSLPKHCPRISCFVVSQFLVAAGSDGHRSLALTA